MFNAGFFKSVFLLIVLANISMVYSAVQCGTSGSRLGCSDAQTFPCQWPAHQCEYQYDYITFKCRDVPSGASVSISCHSDSNVQYQVNMLDGPNYENYYGEMNDGRTCVNGMCDTLVAGTFEWSGVTPNTGNEPYLIVIDKDDYGVCLDIICDIVFSEPSV